MRYRFTSAALLEYEESILFYLTEVSAQIASEFDDEVTSFLTSICANPNAGKPSAGGTREKILDQFPFSIIYEINDNEVVVHALKHHSRDHDYWKPRIR